MTEIAPTSWTYRITLGIAALVGLLVIWFFVIGLGDGSIDGDNIVMWLVLLAVVGGILIAGHLARAHGHPRLAVAILALLAVPAFLYGLFILLVVASGTSWN